MGMVGLFGIIGTCAATSAVFPTVFERLTSRRSTPSRSKSERRSRARLNEQSTIHSTILEARSKLRRSESQSYRLLEIVEVVYESEDTCSFHFKAADGSKLPSYRPGQHLVFDRPACRNTAPSRRCYTLSGEVGETWRVTIRRRAPLNQNDSFSAWAHREWRVGDQLRVSGPRGSFVLDRAASSKPLVLVSAGVGITPMASILHEELSYPRARNKFFFHQIRSLDNAPLIGELISKIERSSNTQATIAVSQLDKAPRISSKHTSIQCGKLNASEMIRSVGTQDCCVFLCGPNAWMESMRTSFVAEGVPDSQVFDESFGGESDNTPSTITVELGEIDAKQPACRVSFEASGVESNMTSDTKTLLALAKKSNVDIPASCRAGRCGTCVVKLLRGEVSYIQEPQVDLGQDEILPCICRPVGDIGIYA